MEIARLAPSVLRATLTMQWQTELPNPTLLLPMTYVLQILDIPHPKTIDDALRMMDEARAGKQDCSSSQGSDGAARMANFARAALRHYPNVANDHDGKRSIWPEELNPDGAVSPVWNIAIGSKGQTNKVFINLANLAAQEKLQILDPQAGLLLRANNTCVDTQNRIMRIPLFEANRNFSPPPHERITICEASSVFAQATAKHLKGLNLKLATDFNRRVYWCRQKEVSWGLYVLAYQPSDGYICWFPQLEFVVPALAKGVLKKVQTERWDGVETLGQLIGRVQRKLGRNYADYSMPMRLLTNGKLPGSLGSRIVPSYQNITEYSEAFLVWFKAEMFPRLQGVSDAAGLRALIDTEDLLDYYNQRSEADVKAREDRFLLALMTEQNSPALAQWRELLPYEWWNN